MTSLREVCSSPSLRVARTTQVMARVAGAAGDDGGGGEAARGGMNVTRGEYLVVYPRPFHQPLGLALLLMGIY